MEKGDVVLINKLKGEQRSTVEENEILAFRYDGKIITHRLVKKEIKSERAYYKTKGDNNSQEDNTVIEEDSVMGKVLFRVKYVGLPSVWLNELFN